MSSEPSLFFAARVGHENPLHFASVEYPFSVTHATLGPNASPGVNTLMVKVGGRPPVSLCNLQLKRWENASLQLVFERGSEVTFSVQGTSQVYVNGSYLSEGGEEEAMLASEEEEAPPAFVEQDEKVEEAQEPEKKKKKKKKKKQRKGDPIRVEEEPDADDDAEVVTTTTAVGGEFKDCHAITVGGEQVVYFDLSKGGGKPVKRHNQIRIRYVGRLASNDQVFDASGRKCFNFIVGKGTVIPGLDHGVRGMRPGGKRKLFIPPELAYGEVGVPPDIPPNSALIFEVEFVAFGAGAGKKATRNMKRQGSPPTLESAAPGTGSRSRRRKSQKRKAGQ